ncbi:MAG TPA: hypothetical protein VME86_02120 [Acidobacteriaceae bacterium]|nr:hypothetical protein [Acidobacteriaceae bacterium]
MKTQFEQNSLEPAGELASTIRDFRSAMTHVADRETARPVSADWLAPARRRRRRARQTMMLSWACAALLCLATLPISLSPHRVVPQPAVAAATTAAAPAPESDSALLEQVDTNVSETVPSPLEPLAELETWNSDSTSTSASNTPSRSSARTAGSGSALTSTENH